MNHVDAPSPLVTAPEPNPVHPPLLSTILSPRQLIILAAAADRIIPPDEYGPGGAAGGSLAYIVRHLEDNGNLASFGEEYGAFLHALDEAGLTSLDSAGQDAVLAAAELSEETGRRRFFRLFAEHVQEGYYTNPENWPGIGFTVTG